MAFRKEFILVLRERKIMFTFSIPLGSKRAPETAQSIIDLMKDLPPSIRKTL